MSSDVGTMAEATVAACGDELHTRALLVVYRGQGADARTQLFEVPDASRVSFGRSRSATVRIDRERVSRNHAQISRDGDTLTLEDLGSRNGTRLNGAKIDGPTTVKSGDEIGVGPVTVIVSVTSQAPARALVGSISYLEERLAAETDRGLRYHRAFALIMLRLDGDTDAVDAAIDRLAILLRPMDVLAEYGPDELAVLAPELDEPTAQSLGERLARAARAVRFAGPRDSKLTVSVGLAMFPVHGTRPGKLLAGAHAALRAARHDGATAVATPPEELTVDERDVIVGDPQMERVFALVDKVADTAMTVLITGETGVGKEIVAGRLHRNSTRKNSPFVRLNCASIPDTLLESELFGHERGAFTGADRRKLGYFEAANGGTIFLDEIGEISPAVQSKLLRVLEEHKLTRVGGTKEIAVDVRIVCATNRDLERESMTGEFRKDLFFRISAFTIVVPALRDRRDEIGLFAEHFATQAAMEAQTAAPRITDAARALMRGYSWPGNVRELRNAIERAMVLHNDGVIDVEHLPERVRDATPSGGGQRRITIGDSVDMRERLADVERAAIVAALESVNGNQTRAAQKLGLSRRALIYKLEKYGLKKPPPSKR